jgi:hypothetical protein
MRPGVLPMTLKQSNRVLNGLVRNPIGQKTGNSRSPTSSNVDNFFRPSRRSAQRICTSWKYSNAEFYKGVTDRLLKCIQPVHPAAFCSQEFFLLHINAPTHKAESVCQFFDPK